MATRSSVKAKSARSKPSTKPAKPAAKSKPKVIAKAKPAAKPKVIAKPKPKPKVIAKAKPAAEPMVAVDGDRDRARLLRDGERFGPAIVSLHPLPDLHVPSGTIVTCDPFTVLGHALARKVPAGRYPVTVAVATFPHGPSGKDDATDQRLAAAFLRLRDADVATWERAAAGDDPAAPGYRIDALTGSFMDARAFAAITHESPYWPTPSFTALEPQLLGDHFQPTWSWAAYQPDPASPGNCVAFMSGAGPGTVTSYWGLDARGAPAVLLTDFDVFSDADWIAR